ncbi:MAG: dipeptidase E [Parcubacteria group bacterium LiPW_41]|nr:MAG: dipeptidase E [Parcubacteria group bacterium LiPW_41]
MKSNGWLFLSGGGNEVKTAEIDSVFLSRLEEKKILYIPIAKNVDQNGYKKSATWLANKLNNQSAEFVEIVLFTNLKNAVNLGEFSAIYIAGGNTYKLLHKIKKYDFLQKIIKYVHEGGVVYGASAGAVLMGVDISTYIENKYLEENKKNNYLSTAGMNLVGEYSILTHFKEEDKDKIGDYFCRNNNPVLAIPEGVAVIIKNGFAEVIGGDILIFQKGQRERFVRAGADFMI